MATTIMENSSLRFFNKYKTEIYFFLWALGIQLIIFVLTYLYGEKGFLWVSDSETYLRLGENLLKHKMFTNDIAWGPTAFRTPLYPLFVAGLWWIVPKVGFVIIIQNLFAAFNVAMVYRLSQRFFGQRVAWWATVLFSIETSRLVLANQLLSETLFFTFFIPAVFYCAEFLFKDGAWKKLALAAFYLGLATLLRPITQFFPLFLVLGFVAAGFYFKQYKRFLLGALLIIAINYAVTAPWIIRNKIVFDEAKLSPLGGIQLYLVNAAHFLEYQSKAQGQQREFYTDLLDRVEKDLNLKINYDNWTYESLRLMEFKYESYMTARFFEIIKSDPWLYARIHLTRSLVFFIDSHGSQAYAATLAKLALPSFIFYPVLFWGGRLVWAFIIFAILLSFMINFREWHKGWPLYVFLILTILYFPAISAMNWMAPRFRLSINHLLFLFFVQSVFWLYQKIYKREL